MQILIDEWIDEKLLAPNFFFFFISFFFKNKICWKYLVHKMAKIFLGNVWHNWISIFIKPILIQMDRKMCNMFGKPYYIEIQSSSIFNLIMKTAVKSNIWEKKYETIYHAVSNQNIDITWPHSGQ